MCHIDPALKAIIWMLLAKVFFTQIIGTQCIIEFIISWSDLKGTISHESYKKEL